MINYTGSREQEFKPHPFTSKSNTKLRIFTLGYDEILCRYKVPNFEEQKLRLDWESIRSSPRDGSSTSN